MIYKVVVCGGTFDNFHKGHISLLKLAFSLGKKVIIGVTSDIYAQNSKFNPSASLRARIQSSPLRPFGFAQGFEGQAKLIESFAERKEAVLEFVKAKGSLDRVEIIKIDDIFGPTLDRSLEIDAIVVSKDTKKGGELINERRRRLGLKDLKILITPNALAEDGQIISSERIRKGEINRDGRLYINPLWLKHNLILPESLREEFRKPFGTLSFNVSKHQNKFSLVVSVGDVTTKKFNQLSINQKISVVDFKVRRKKKFYHIKELDFSGKEKVIKIKNPPGTLTPSLFEAAKTIWREKGRIILQILGEEDLSVLPLVLTAPLGTHIFYGQPNQGMIKVVVSEETKDKAYELANRFEIPKQVRNDR